MSKIITWTELNGFHRAFISDKEVGFCYKLAEVDDKFIWITGSKNGLSCSLIEAMESIKNIQHGKL